MVDFDYETLNNAGFLNVFLFCPGQLPPPYSSFSPFCMAGLYTKDDSAEVLPPTLLYFLLLFTTWWIAQLYDYLLSTCHHCSVNTLRVGDFSVQAWWHMPIIPALGRMEAGGLQL